MNAPQPSPSALKLAFAVIQNYPTITHCMDSIPSSVAETREAETRFLAENLARFLQGKMAEITVDAGPPQPPFSPIKEGGVREAAERAAVNSAAQIGDAVKECASRLLGMVKNEKVLFVDFPHREATEINLRQLEEMSDELRTPGSTKWGTPAAQSHYKSQTAQLAHLLADNAALREALKLAIVHLKSGLVTVQVANGKEKPGLMWFVEQMTLWEKHTDPKITSLDAALASPSTRPPESP